MKIKEKYRLRNSLYYTLAFISILWMIKFSEWLIFYDLGFLGIYPRKLLGIVGIFTGPLIHGDFFHLLSNTFPLLFLGTALFFFYGLIVKKVLIWIYLMTGIWVWVAGRDAYHIGASGLVYGILAFIFFSGVFRRDSRPIAVSLVVLFLYGGMFYGLIPNDGSISWESHIFGSIAGLFCAFYFRKQNGGFFESDQNEKAMDNFIQCEFEDVHFNYSFKPSVRKEIIKSPKIKVYYYSFRSNH